MKPYTSKIAFWGISATLVASICSLTYATSAPRGDGDLDKNHKTSGEKKSKTVKFAHDKDIDTYLTSVRSFMLVPPRNGLFGASRVPTLHGATGEKIPGYKEVQDLAADKYMINSFVVGKMPDEVIAAYEKSAKEGRFLGQVPHYRVTPVHMTFLEGADRRQESQTIAAEVRKRVTDLDAECMKEDYEDYSTSFDVAGHHAWLMAKAVRASDKTCYSCHTNIKEGQPIGYVMAALIEKAP
ncbi:MAG: hypothetical protein JST12_12775 [Armatimonadetes bacterium]|nr:hypothetical protein [Armatimonadota bacterium]